MAIIKPLLTEKTMRLSQAGEFTFLVDKTASKPIIAAAVESKYKVKVIRVAVSRLKPSLKKTGKRRLMVKTSLRKKAVIKLEKGQTIEAFSVKASTKKTKKSKESKQ